MKFSIKEILVKIPRRTVVCGIAVLGVLLIGLGVFGAYRLFGPAVIRGIDVSNYQGDISWRAIAESGQVKYVFMKATEGQSFRDPYFENNWKSAAQNGIPAGAYHFYSPTSPGDVQARNFIATVPKEKGKLPPVLDIETAALQQTDFKNQVAVFVRMITQQYGQKPVFYTPYKVYNILYDDYKGYDFWVIDVAGRPAIKGWTFWQYSDKGSVAGIDGKVDLDQYQGSRWSFRRLLSQ